MSRKSRVRAPPGAVLHELHQAGWLVTVRWRSCSPVDFATPSPFFFSQQHFQFRDTNLHICLRYPSLTHVLSDVAV